VSVSHFRVPVNAVLMVIDLQISIDHPSWGRRNNPGCEKAVARLLAAWRARKMPIVHIRHDSREPNSHYRPGQPGNDFKPEVAPLPTETVIPKSTNSAFIGTHLEAFLREHGYETLVVTGVITNNSVEATVRMAGNLGFDTYVVADACFTVDKRDLAGELHPAERVHALSLANMHGEYATVVESKDIMASLP
jgi:nicotinamidase-related amidase